MSEQELIDELKSGNADAFRKIVFGYQQMVVRTAFAYLKNLNEAEDLAQEVFISVYENISKFRGESNLKTWIYRITINKSINEIRRLKWKQKLVKLENFFTSNEDHFVDNVTPLKLLLDKQGEQAVDEAMAKLPQNQRTAFILHKYDDLSHQEISEIMQMSVSSIESLIFRAKQNLQKNLLNISKK